MQNKKFKILFTIASKSINYLGINLVKFMEDIYTKNYKMFKSKIKEDKQRDTIFTN